MKTPTEFKILRVRECVATDPIDTPERAAAYWRANIPSAPWYDPAKEAFVVLVLNTRRRIIGHNLVTLGSLDTCHVYPREVFRPAIAAAGSALVLMHNHPSGDPSPSSADITVTQELVRAGKFLKIEIIDHVIIGERYVSLREQGHIT